MDREIDFERLENTADIERTCVVQFKVTKEGILEDIKIVRPVNPLADMEALRVVRKMNEIAGPWVPATYKGEAVSITFNLPVKFIRGYYAEKLAKE